MQEITTIEQFDVLVSLGWIMCIYKYNPNNCILSTKTKPIVEKAEKDYTIDTYRIDVHVSPKLKLHIANLANIEHESPQCIIFRDKKVIAHTAMMHISLERFADVLLEK